MSKVNDSNFWEQRYKEEATPWDIGEAAPAFKKYFRTGKLESVKEPENWRVGETESQTPSPPFPLSPSVAVLGCGRGHDAFYLATNKECKVHAFDFSESAINHCNKVKENNNLKNIHFHQADIFELVKDKKWKGFFDYTIEHTFFCAIDPSKRNEYIELIKYLLKPDGKLVGLFFMKPKELGGPPFGSTPEEIKNFFKKDFKEIEELHLEPCLHQNLQGEEWFGVFQI